MQEAFFPEDFGSEPLWPLRVHEDDPSAAKRIVGMVAVGLAFGIVCATGRVPARHAQHIESFCAADGILAAFILSRPRRCWWQFLVAAWLGDAVSLIFAVGSVWLSAGFAFCNVVEVLIAAFGLRCAIDRDGDLASPSVMLRFLFFAVTLGPASAAFLRSALDLIVHGEHFLPAFARVFPAYAVGMAIMMPLTLALCDPNLRKIFNHGRRLRSIGVLLLVLLVAIAAFRQTHYSLRSLCLPLLMLTGFEVGILGSVLAIFEILVVGSFYTLRGQGTLWMDKGATLHGSVLTLQFAIMVLLVSVVPFAAVLERQAQLRARLRLGMRRYRLLADNSRDIVVLLTLTGRPLYASPAVQDLLGWTQEEWTGRDSADLMHPDDVAAFQQMLREILHRQDRRMFRYRTQHKDGQYLWIEAGIRPLSNEVTGMPDGFVANLRDISLRVDAERKLSEAHREVRQQAQRDSLTELVNRHRFDEALETEWRRGRRTGNPLALLLVDVDRFQRINDTYGHRAGDHCLQAIAADLRLISRRPGDLAARYDGDEFAVLLPDVNLATAMVLADRLCLCVRERLIDAGVGQPLALTVSIGVVAQVPDMNVRADLLVEAADEALHEAKRAGRNRVAILHDIESAAPLLHRVQ